MNVNFGLLPPLPERLRGKAKKELMSHRALADLESWMAETRFGDTDLNCLKPAVSFFHKAALP